MPFRMEAGQGAFKSFVRTVVRTDYFPGSARYVEGHAVLPSPMEETSKWGILQVLCWRVREGQ